MMNTKQNRQVQVYDGDGMKNVPDIILFCDTCDDNLRTIRNQEPWIISVFRPDLDSRKLLKELSERDLPLNEHRSIIIHHDGKITHIKQTVLINVHWRKPNRTYELEILKP